MSKLLIAGLCLAVFSTIAMPSGSTFADHPKVKAPKVQGGHNHGGGSNFHGGGFGRGFGDFHQVDISPWGIGYGFYGDNFGIRIGPIGVGDFGPVYPQRGYFNDGPYFNPPMVVETVPAQGAAPQPVIAANERAAGFQYEAEQAFRQSQYEHALRLSNHALVEDGENGKLHLFASQCLFAVGDYRSAAVAIHQGVSLLEADERGFVVQNFRRFYTNSDYVSQMEKLVEYTRENPEAAYARLVRGYHYTYLGHKDAARQQLYKVLELEPSDAVAQQLLALVGDNVPAPVPVSEDESDESVGDEP